MMTGLDHIIGDLLLRHNCVIIPSFGGFVAKRVSAKIDMTRGIMSPPSKSVLFNRQLINNDGLVINEFAVRNDWSYTTAEEKIAEIVKDWNQEIRLGKRVEIDRVGILYMDQENKVCFEQDRFFNLLLESFGLGNVNFVPEAKVLEPEFTIEHKEEVRETKIINIQPENPVVEEIVAAIGEDEVVPVIKRRSSTWKYVAAACMIPVLFYSIWIPVKTDVLESGVISIKDFNPFYHSSEGTYSDKPLLSSVKVADETPDLAEELDQIEGNYYTYRVDGTSFIAVDLGRMETSETPAPETTVPVVNPEAMNFIVGCFSNESNAANLVAKLRSQGFDARIVDFHNGLHRVTAGEAISLESLFAIRSKAQSQGFNGWILK